jgi:acetyltransferase
MEPAIDRGVLGKTQSRHSAYPVKLHQKARLPLLELRPSCECCDVDLPADSPLARICSFECTFCATCAERLLHGRCPNCGGELLARPRRAIDKLDAHPASTRRVSNPKLRSKSSVEDSQRTGAKRSGTIAPTPALRRVSADERVLLEPLAELLIDAVHSGASIGFLAPLSRSTAEQYWRGVLSAVGELLLLWVAEIDGRVVGSVQLALCDKDNGRHRGEVQKLFVHRSARGHGIATRLMDEVEAEARRRQRRLLVLDTLLGSQAEEVYRHLNWTRAGEIPEYAASPAGELFPTVVYFKALTS